jgi:formylglycine-generating enzyme required for sulfatase activity
LKSLLPEGGADIKGQMRSEAELRDASGYAEQPADFDDLVRILDTELRLISPTDTDGIGVRDHPAGARPSSGRYYQLTHDYLVHSLRDWLTRKQRETRRGRAELMIEERAALWSAKPESRRLPSLLEWWNIRILTDRRNWTKPQRRMMKVAARRYSTRMAWTGALLAVASAALLASGAWVEHWRRQNEARWLISQVIYAEWDRLPDVLARLAPAGDAWRDIAKSIAADGSRPPADRLRARLALAPHDAVSAREVLDGLAVCTPRQLRIVWGRLESWSNVLCPRLWTRLGDAESTAESRCRIACALARGDPSNPRWLGVGPDVVDALLEEKDPLSLTGWVELLTPVGSALVDSLSHASLERKRPLEQRLVAASMLAELGKDQPEQLIRVLLEGDERQGVILARVLARDPDAFAARLRRELEEREGSSPGAVELNHGANAALGLARLGQWQPVWPLLRHAPDPSLRTRLVALLGDAVAPTQLIEGLRAARDPSARQAMLFALGGQPGERLTERERTGVVAECRELYEHDPDSGVHAAAEWLLRKWGRNRDLDELRDSLKGRGQIGNWYVNAQGMTMVVVKGPVTFAMGSPDSELRRDQVEVHHTRVIDRSFAISAHEVTVAQFRAADPSARPGAGAPSEGELPISRISWYDAIRFCRRLSEKEHLGESEQCYPEKIGPDMKLPDDFLTRTGYRLPTDGEWEYTCRAGTMTSRFFGDDDSMLGEYAWFSRNADDRLWPVGLLKPNPWGLFDVLGNGLEWCQNAPQHIESHQVSTQVRDDRFRASAQDSPALRGGGYRYSPREIRSAKMIRMAPDAATSFLVLRVARTIK